MTKRLSSIFALAAALLLPALSVSFTLTSSTVRSSNAAALYGQQNPNNDDESGKSVELNRRSFNTVSAAAALSALLVTTSSNIPFLPIEPAMAADYDDSTKKKQRILITGSNSGIGLDAAQRLALRGHEVVLACVSESIVVYMLFLYIIIIVHSSPSSFHVHIQTSALFISNPRKRNSVHSPRQTRQPT